MPEYIKKSLDSEDDFTQGLDYPAENEAGFDGLISGENPDFNAEDSYQELTAESESRDLELALVDIQKRIKELERTQELMAAVAEKTDDRLAEELVDSQSREDELIKIISRRAKNMMKEDQYVDFAANMQRGITAEFDKILEIIGNTTDNGEQIETAVAYLIASLKPRVEIFIKESGLLDETGLAKVLEDMDNCVTANRDDFINGLIEALRPIVVAREENPKAAELAQRKAFLRSSVGGESFKVIEDTDEILSYGGLESGYVHLHLAPMRTLSRGEQLAFVKKTLPEAFHKLAKIIEVNDQVTVVVAISYVVAAIPDVFSRLGFEISALEPDDRNRHWGGEKRPVLRASISRDNFLKLYGDK